MIKRRYRRLKNFHKLNKLVKNGGFGNHHILELGRTSELVTNAQRLHASVYLTKGFINPDDVGHDGIIKYESDPHQVHAHYFAAMVKESGRANIVATARQIECNPKKGIESFPILNKAKIYSRALIEINAQNPQSCVEISGLAKKFGSSTEATLLLYREMWYRSLRDGHTMWLMACDESLYERLHLMFGDSIKKIGSKTKYQGGTVIPAMLRPYEAITSLTLFASSGSIFARSFRKRLLRFFCEGYPRELLDPQQKKALKKLGALPHHV